MTRPWTNGPNELLQHAIEHMKEGADFDKRISMISIDNAVELCIRIYLNLPKRVLNDGQSNPTRRELQENENFFPGLLDLLEKYASSRIIGINLEDIEWYHRIRNQLYHSGTGITVNTNNLETYLQLAISLYENLFDEHPNLKWDVSKESLIGSFLSLWVHFEREFRKQLPPKKDFAYFWKRNYLSSVDPSLVHDYDKLFEFRNNLVHGTRTIETEDFNNHINLLKEFMKKLKISIP